MGNSTMSELWYVFYKFTATDLNLNQLNEIRNFISEWYFLFQAVKKIDLRFCDMM